MSCVLACSLATLQYLLLKYLYQRLLFANADLCMSRDCRADLIGAENAGRPALRHKDSSRVELCFYDGLIELLSIQLQSANGIFATPHILFCKEAW